MSNIRNKTLSIGQSALSPTNEKTNLSGSNPQKTNWQKRLIQLAVQLTPLVVILLVWELGTGAFDIPKFIEPALVGKPSNIVQELKQLFLESIPLIIFC
jgi:NitT/TauT family transport system permease protein